MSRLRDPRSPSRLSLILLSYTQLSRNISEFVSTQPEVQLDDRRKIDAVASEHPAQVVVVAKL